MSKKEDIELEIQDVVEEEKAASQEELESIKEQTKNTLQKIKENAKEGSNYMTDFTVIYK